MKENRGVSLPITLMFGILVVLLVFMSLPFDQVEGRASGGRMDIESSVLRESIVQLTGEWQYTSGQLYEPGDFPDNAPTIMIPMKWAKDNESLNSCATYRLVILTDDDRPLMIFIPEIYTAKKLWFNGELINEVGVVSSDPKVGEPSFSTSLVPTHAVDGRLEIVIQASNYHFMRPHMNNVLLAGETEQVQSWFFRTRILYGLSMGFVLAAFFYHLALYVFRRKQPVYLLFSLICFSCFIRFSLETNGISDLLGWFSASGVFDMRLFTAMFFLHGVLVALFSLYVFDREWVLRYLRWITLYCTAGFIVCWFIPLNIVAGPFISLAYMFPFMLLAIIKSAGSPALRENRYLLLYIVALIFFVIMGGISKGFFDHILFMPGLITNMFLLMSQSLILAKEYNDSVVKEQWLEVENVALDRVNQLKNELLANITHEMRTPLAVMSAYAQLAVKELQKENISPQTTEDLLTIQTEAARLAEMASGFLDVFKDKGGEKGYSTISVSAMLTQIGRLCAPILKKKNNGLTMNITGDLPEISGNADELTQVMLNLVTNANNHTKDGRIDIAASVQIAPAPGEKYFGKVDVETVEILITDDGEGIPEELLPRVFERNIGDGKSTGIGLSISREIVEAHGGTITIESEPGSGTRVMLALPAARQRIND